MKALLLNCDLGERGQSPAAEDEQLLPLIQIANLACGGHAGDAASARHFAELAARLGVRVTLHLSYPDPAHFGRRSLALPWPVLDAALNRQRACLPKVTWVKLHGALYHDAATREPLARALLAWGREQGLSHWLAPTDSALARAAGDYGQTVLGEVFAERRYARLADGRLTLVPRSEPHACLTTVPEALAQVRQWLRDGTVNAIAPTGWPATERVPLAGKTVCVHSDSPIALPLLQALAAWRAAAPAGEPG